MICEMFIGRSKFKATGGDVDQIGRFKIDASTK